MRSQTPTFFADPAPSSAIDTEALLGRLLGERSLLLMVAEAARTEIGRLVTELDAVPDAPALARVAHALKGAFANLSAGPARLAAVGVERAALEGDPTLAFANVAALRAAAQQVLGALLILAAPADCRS